MSLLTKLAKGLLCFLFSLFRDNFPGTTQTGRLLLVSVIKKKIPMANSSHCMLTFCSKSAFQVSIALIILVQIFQEWLPCVFGFFFFWCFWKECLVEIQANFLCVIQQPGTGQEPTIKSILESLNLNNLFDLLLSRLCLFQIQTFEQNQHQSNVM